MKIYINRKPVDGPWGGGNKSLKLLSEMIVEKGYELTYSLEENIDLIFCYDPRPCQKGVWYQDFINYKLKNPRTRIVQRVGDVGTHSKPELQSLLKEIVKVGTTDFFIFPSEWARKVINHKDENYVVIPNRPMEIFYENRSKRNQEDKIKMVTHHWSDNDKKGFALYEELGKRIASGLRINGKEVLFTYIGRYSNRFSRSGIEINSPIDAASLSREIPKNDFYLTASLEEAGANHVLEAMAAGVPVFYHNLGGSIPEYCKDFGYEYNSIEELIDSLSKIDRDYFYSKNRVLKYKGTIKDSVESYMRVIEDVNC